MSKNPMHQFEVYKIGPEIKFGSVDLSFTNASLFMLISATIICFFLFLGSKNKSIIPNKIQLIAELFYNFIAKMISDTAGSKVKPYFPFIFSLFMFVLLCNMVGMLPYSFTVTSHIIVTLIMALFIFIAVTIIGFLKHGFKYLSIFDHIFSNTLYYFQYSTCKISSKISLMCVKHTRLTKRNFKISCRVILSTKIGLQSRPKFSIFDYDPANKPSMGMRVADEKFGY